jgi:L-cysteine:1D-myo-inositol 2-amino-2-deoxy-alpha-D-glucopyranoside ligase
VAQDTGPDATDLVARLRAHLADDLDTPGALAAVDAWAEQARGGGDDPTAPRLVRDAVDALLGVAL